MPERARWTWLIAVPGPGTYEVELENDSITFPPQNELGGQAVWDEDETQCDGEDAEVSVKAWQSFTDTDSGTRYVANMDNIHIDNDGMVFAIYFTADDEPQVMPPWAQQLPQLGAIDSGQVLPDDLLQSDASVVTGSVPTGADGSDDAGVEESGTGDDAGTTETDDDADATDTSDG